ncbi:alpha-L-fucosidase 2 isoform X2 [Asparagus officinalis]|uniref:alpha-L-fucosidase 2 isoform X2 n=1 Tax=Asparagus officinalis TaxID=4686 RepID=UPI00098E4561|nr:alpha-L-fucosidase 2 isoform X2 [Asparagus officinalis]
MDLEGKEEGWVWVRRPNEGDSKFWGLMDPIQDPPPSPPPLTVVFTEPAKHWTDAAPIGNGRLGAMIWGGVCTETLQLNHDTLWTGMPGDYTNRQSPVVVSNVRKLVDNGQFVEASLAANGLLGHLSEVYQPLGNINIDFDDCPVGYSAYGRELNLTTATVKVSYTVGDVEFTREHFCSYPHQVLVTNISSNKSGSLSFTVSLDSELPYHSSVNAANQIIMEGSCPAKRILQKGNTSVDLEGIQFSAVIDLQIGGEAGTIRVVDDNKLKVEGSDWAVLLLAASSSFEGPFTKPSDSKKDPTLASVDTLNAIRNMSFSKLLAYHLDDYQNLFNRVSLQLSKGSNATTEDSRPINQIQARTQKSLIASSCGRPKLSAPAITTKSTKNAMVSTAERVKSFNVNEDPSLVELLFQYGRYLLISCSRPGTQVANLQGIWNKETEPAWDAAPHLNINLQMNYWPSLSCNLSECQEPLFDYIASLSVNGARTAKVNYEANGWVTHHISDIWAKTSPDRGKPKYAVWPIGGAWLCTHLWEHYSFTMDKVFLENIAYPLLEGCALFLLDWLIEGQRGYLETNPSTSPEHLFIAPDGQTASISYSTTMDMAIIKEIFSIITYAAEVLEKSDSCLINQIKIALLKLPPTRISWDGSVMEWAQDFEDPEVHHRHLSHLFGLFPGHTMTLWSTPDLCKAAAKSLYKRGDEGPGWSTTWKMALWAHLHNSEHAYKLVKKLINLVDPDHEKAFEGGLYSNLFTAHPPFQIDANFGFTAAIAEMLVQSTEQDLYLLPALPVDKWAEGCVRGLKARGDVTINISWKEGVLHEACFCSKNRNSVRRLHYKGKVANIELSSNRIHTFDKHLKCLRTHPSLEGTT